MRKKPIFLIFGILIPLFLCICCGFFLSTHVFLDGKIYPRSPEQLDLRGTEISAAHYERLRGTFSDCEIKWDVPFQEAFFPEDTQLLTIQTLTEDDVERLKYFPALKTLHAEECKDYPQLASAKVQYPHLEICYQVSIDGHSYPQDTQELTVSHITDEDISLLQYLPCLNTIHAENCDDLSKIDSLCQCYPNISVSWNVPIGGEDYSSNTSELTLTEAQINELVIQFPYLPALRRVTLIDPIGSAEGLLTLRKTYPQIDFSWQRSLFGITITSEDKEVDLTGIPLDSLDPVETELEYFPNVEKVILSGCGIDNETMAAFRERMRNAYKVVWTVDIGYLNVRTDEIWYMPGKYKLGVTDEQAYNLRYCEDMICIDVGHKPVSNCEWAAFMPNLKYLILADTDVTDLTPLTGLEHLIYLEVFLTKVTDYSPLVTCTALEDLNLSYTYGDPAPIQKMTWLKRLWWADCPVTTEEFREYLPDAEMMFLHNSSTGNGWRQGQNYYDMREILGMYIMWG